MIRLAWRQFRAPAIVAVAALVVVGAFAAITGPSLAHAYDVTLAACTTTGDCASAMRTFALNDGAIRGAFTTLLVLVPALVGAFWGAPPHRPRDRGGHVPARVDARRHPHALARRQAGRGGPGQRARDRPVEPHRHVVGAPARPGGGVPV